MSRITERKLRYGMVGGGPGAFIGAVHRAGIGINNNCNLVAGCFSRDKNKNAQTGKEYSIENRLYSTYEEMAEKEFIREDKIDFVVIVTRNDSHYEICKAFLEKGINVMIEKPFTINSHEAEELKQLAEEKDLVLGVAYAYTGHVMAKEARNIIKSGEIGDVLVVMGEYPQDWLMNMVTEKNHGISAWRIEKKQAGNSNCTGDIGSHIENMVSYMTGLKIDKLSAIMDRFGENTELDNNAHIMLKYDNGATGTYWCSQVAIGNDNGLWVRIYGTKGSVEFKQEASNYLLVTKKGCPPTMYSRGHDYISEQAAKFSRVPSGHPEGYHEAFANLYVEFCNCIYDKLDGKKIDTNDYDFPKADDGINGVKFIEKCLESAEDNSKWVEMKYK